MTPIIRMICPQCAWWRSAPIYVDGMRLPVYTIANVYVPCRGCSGHNALRDVQIPRREYVR